MQSRALSMQEHFFYARTIQFIPSENRKKTLVTTLEKKSFGNKNRDVLIDFVHDD